MNIVKLTQSLDICLPSYFTELHRLFLYALQTCIQAERGRHGHYNQENCNASNEPIGKCFILMVSRRDRCEKRHFGHPGGTTEAAVGVWCQRAQETAAEGVRYTLLGLHTALNMFYMISEKTNRHGKLEEKKVKEVKLKSVNEATFFGDKYIIGTARSDGHYYL